MANKRHRLIKAVEHNWGLMRPGDWSKVEWRIFTDGSYETITTFHTFVERKERAKRVRKRAIGQMEKKLFSRLRKALKCNPWRDPALMVHACDGEAWMIESYRADGSVDKTSGRLDYIYGHRNLEAIVDLLPKDGNQYGSSAYYDIDRKEESIFRRLLNRIREKIKSVAQIDK